MQGGGFGVARNPFTDWVPVSLEKGVLHASGGEVSFKGGFGSGREMVSSWLLDYPSSVHHYSVVISESLLYFVGCLLDLSTSVPSNLSRFPWRDTRNRKEMWALGALHGVEGLRMRRWFLDYAA